RLQVVPDRNPHQDAEDEADHDRFADEFQLFLDERRVDFDPVHAGDFVIDFVQQQIDGNGGDGKPLGNGNAGKADLLLHPLGRNVGEFERDDAVGGGPQEPVPEASRDRHDDGAREGEVPEVPDVDVDGFRQPQQQHGEVDQNDHRNDDGADPGGEGHARGGRPAGVHDGQIQVEPLHEQIGDRPDVVPDQVQHQVQADEPDADRDAGAQRLADFEAENQTHDENDDRQHEGGSE